MQSRSLLLLPGPSNVVSALTPRNTNECRRDDEVGTMTMSALGTAGEASGAEMTVPVGRYDVVKSVLWFRLYTSLVVTIKAPDGTGEDTCRSYNSLGEVNCRGCPFSLHDSPSPSKPMQWACSFTPSPLLDLF